MFCQISRAMLHSRYPLALVGRSVPGMRRDQSVRYSKTRYEVKHVYNTPKKIMMLILPVEDFRRGYPRFAALISAHPPFFICRSFNRIRARLLLLKQDKLSVLERQLDHLDDLESSALFLGKSRCDSNAERLSLLTDIESCLVDYGTFPLYRIQAVL